MAVIRDWTEARAKCDEEGCRVCGGRAEAAHILGRRHDQPKREGGKVLWVNPLHIIPLCRREHTKYDAHELDISGLLTEDELAEAVRLAGYGSAMRRITSSRDV